MFRHGSASHRNNVQFGRFGRNRSNVREYHGITSSFGRATEEGNLLALHPTVKPVAMVADAILDCSVRGDLVLDCFLGTGTTALEAQKLGRRYIGIEINPEYVKIAEKRLMQQALIFAP